MLKTDASNKGWGAHFESTSTGGCWLPTEATDHINCLELRAVWLGLQAFCSKCTDARIQLYIDNTTAVTYINKMGGSHSLACNKLARDIWLWCLPKNIWLTACHLPGSLNVEADKTSRTFHDQTEWKLDAKLYLWVTEKFYKPEIDLFASRLNHQMKPYAAIQTRCSTSVGPQTETHGLQLIRQSLARKGLAAEAVEVIMHVLVAKLYLITV